jgi:hypothetical protein
MQMKLSKITIILSVIVCLSWSQSTTNNKPTYQGWEVHFNGKSYIGYEFPEPAISVVKALKNYPVYKWKAEAYNKLYKKEKRLRILNVVKWVGACVGCAVGGVVSGVLYERLRNR